MDHPSPGTSTRPADEAFRCGFYLHACWKFRYPFAVRTWSVNDFQGMFALLREMGFNLVMFWPPFECIPPPVGKPERDQLLFYRDLVERAQRKGLESWVVATANCTVPPEISRTPVEERHYYPERIDVRLDHPDERQAYLIHRAEMQKILNNADAYVTIDGDPGGYPQADPRHYVDVLLADRATIDEFGTHPSAQKIVPWIWCGWGSDWKRNGPWKEPIAPLNVPLLQEIKDRMTGPWELLPGRSCWDDWANGRTNFALAQEAGLINRSVLLTYELIEFEPTPPGVSIQFDHIRRVFRQEEGLIAQARGLMGNAQQPVMALPNLFFFGRAARDRDYLERSDNEVLRDLADWLGGEPDLLVPAWDCLRLGLAEIPENLPDRLATSALRSRAASFIPGGPARYLEILAAFVRARVSILVECEGGRREESQAVVIARCLAHAHEWWLLHRYVYSGESGDGFRLGYVQAGLLSPLTHALAGCGAEIIRDAVRLFALTGASPDDIRYLARDLEILSASRGEDTP